MFDYEIFIINTINLIMNANILEINQKILEQNKLREKESKIVVNLLEQILETLKRSEKNA